MVNYNFWISRSNRWAAVVDYASPVSAWTTDMFKILEQCNGNKVQATKELRKLRAEGAVK